MRGSGGRLLTPAPIGYNSLSPPERGEGWGEGFDSNLPAYLQLENYGLLCPALSSIGEEREKNGAAILLAAAYQFPA